jgi:MraZ protein
MYRFSFDYTIDDKYRLLIPANFREELGEQFVVSRGIGGACIWLLSMQQWEERIESKLKRPAPVTQQVMDLERFLYLDLQEGRLDKEGRLCLSKRLLDFAKIDVPSALQVAGLNWRIEIWAKNQWRATDGEMKGDVLLQTFRELDKPLEATVAEPASTDAIVSAVPSE